MYVHLLQMVVFQHKNDKHVCLKGPFLNTPKLEKTFEDLH